MLSLEERRCDNIDLWCIQAADNEMSPCISSTSCFIWDCLKLFFFVFTLLLIEEYSNNLVLHSHNTVIVAMDRRLQSYRKQIYF